MTIYGYARCSGTSQDLDGQIELLRQEGVDLIFSERVSGKDVDGRKEFQRLLAKVTDGDVIICTKLDRFARSTRDLLNIVHDLKQRGVGLKCLQDAWLDTTSPVGELVLTVMAGISTFERHLIKARCDDGRKRAVERGVKLGRKPKLSPYQREELLNRLAAGETQSALALSYKISQSTISEMARGL